jgi:hypothetical protein
MKMMADCPHAGHPVGIPDVTRDAASRRVKQKTGAEFVGYIELPQHNGQSKSEKWQVTREAWLSRSPASPV